MCGTAAFEPKRPAETVSGSQPRGEGLGYTAGAQCTVQYPFKVLSPVSMATVDEAILSHLPPM